MEREKRRERELRKQLSNNNNNKHIPVSIISIPANNKTRTVGQGTYHSFSHTDVHPEEIISPSFTKIDNKIDDTESHVSTHNDWIAS